MQLYDAAVNNKFFAGFAGSFHPPFSPMHPFSPYEIVSLRLKQLNIRPKQRGPQSLRLCDGVAQTGHLFSGPRMITLQQLASSNVDAHALFELISRLRGGCGPARSGRPRVVTELFVFIFIFRESRLRRSINIPIRGAYRGDNQWNPLNNTWSESLKRARVTAIFLDFRKLRKWCWSQGRWFQCGHGSI